MDAATAASLGHATLAMPSGAERDARQIAAGARVLACTLLGLDAGFRRGATVASFKECT